MINANELRIGNLVYPSEENARGWPVQGLWEDGAFFGYPLGWEFLPQLLEEPMVIPYSTLEPIPLTEEWLKKLEFETSSYVATGDFYIHGEKIIKVGDYNYKILVIAEDWTTWKVSYVTNPYMDESYQKTILCSLKKINFVHEFQNYFFALCGQELTLNET